MSHFGSRCSVKEQFELNTVGIHHLIDCRGSAQTSSLRTARGAQQSPVYLGRRTVSALRALHGDTSDV